MDRDDYRAYLKRPLYYGATERTLQGISGLVFRRKTQAEIPLGKLASDLIANVDQRGSSHDRFAQTVFDEVFTSGRAGVYVSLPESFAPGARARQSIYRYEQIINWDEENNPDGSPRLTRVVFFEQPLVVDPQDPYTKKRIDQYRDVHIDPATGVVRVDLRRKRKDVDSAAPGNNEEVIYATRYPVFRGTALTEIPFVCINARSLGMEIEKPPLLPLADANIYHWTQMADRRHAEHNVAAATGLYITADGIKATDVKFGPQAVLTVPKSDAKVGLIEYSGQGLTPLQEGIDATTGYMATLGARLLEVQKASAETAETHRLRQGREQATVAGTVQNINDGLSISTTTMLKLSGVDGEARIEANTDLVDAKLTPDEMRVWMEAVQTKAVTFDVYWKAMQKGEMVPNDITSEEAQKQLAVESEQSLPAPLPAHNQEF
tara:strand:- start:912 stop:2213 length:1302 start_codon:yes stop_codon:yes gene_type:complete